MIKKLRQKRLRGHCNITGKYRGSAHRDCNTDVKLNHKLPIVFHNLMTHILLCNFKIKVTPGGLDSIFKLSSR